ncbi:helix-turn-helix domain-containing protein [Kribbella shirazensis]|uniref:Transcriptional regulator with XRE-family HTH domain n=1 Tax=Kribbella shirazensis TaxID=1105143 RepID=A0A7X5V9N4_9ACTN|nr:helix-turn-helix transcriptional regulator [Kribbella shirazensis]NIK57204.1 transcriptional regulator with XRE-family HTH domain [Kribbella shirazensis]
MESTNALGDYLRARREQVRPEDVGIRSIGLRRVPGLRREEVAMLAGISSDYYLRLEQGRDRNPSVQVLESLAAVLRLDADATAYLIGLAQERPAPRPRIEQAPDSIVELINGWPDNPAYVQNRYTDVLAVNPLCAALSPNYAVGVNLLTAVLLDPVERTLRRDWEELTEEGVGALRSELGSNVDDARLKELVGDLSVRSERFRQLWARHDVRPRRGRVSLLTHPEVGDIALQSDKLTVSGTDNMTLVVFHATPGSRDAELLALLGSLVASTDEAAARNVRPSERRPE